MHGSVDQRRRIAFVGRYQNQVVGKDHVGVRTPVLVLSRWDFDSVNSHRSAVDLDGFQELGVFVQNLSVDWIGAGIHASDQHVIGGQKSSKHVDVLCGLGSERAQKQQAFDIRLFFEGIDDQLPSFVFNIGGAIFKREPHVVVFKESS